ncbi:hypothetical protein [Chitinophaga sp. XS-30]|nr:hypothetical protein [Chitinophaga sp. XS-30]
MKKWTKALLISGTKLRYPERKGFVFVQKKYAVVQKVVYALFVNNFFP